MFTPVNARAANAYRQVAVDSRIDGASPHQLIAMLFDGLQQSLAAARGAIGRGDTEGKGRHIGRAVRILEEGLKGGLNPSDGGALAANLRTLYSYCVTRLTQANLKSDATAVEEVAQLVAPVADGWADIAAVAQAAHAAPPVSHGAAAAIGAASPHRSLTAYAAASPARAGTGAQPFQG